MRRHWISSVVSLAGILLFAIGVAADDRPAHHPAMDADGIEQTVSHLKDANHRLAELLLHAAEDMHFPSEGLKREALLDYGHAYLEGIKPIVS